MKRTAAVLLLALTVLGAAPPPDCETRPTWCQPGFVCQPTACAAAAAVQLTLLTAETEALRKRKARRWSCTLGPGAGVYLQVTDGHVDLDAAPLVGAVVCGWTF